MNTEVMFSSKAMDWATPQTFFDQLDSEFHFTLDPCANESNHKCDHYYTEADDGLTKPWGADGLLQPAIWQSDQRLGEEMLRRSSAAQHNCCIADSGQNRYSIFPRLHLSKTKRGDTLSAWPAQIWRWQKFRSLSQYGCYFSALRQKYIVLGEIK